MNAGFNQLIVKPEIVQYEPHSPFFLMDNKYIMYHMETVVPELLILFSLIVVAL